MTTDKELFHLVQRIHKCGYLDNIPEPLEEVAPVAEETPAAPAPAPAPAPVYEAQEQEEEYEETYQESAPEYTEAISEAPSESYFSGSASEQIQQTSTMQSVQTDVSYRVSRPSSSASVAPEGSEKTEHLFCSERL